MIFGSCQTIPIWNMGRGGGLDVDLVDVELSSTCGGIVLNKTAAMM